VPIYCAKTVWLHIVFSSVDDTKKIKTMSSRASPLWWSRGTLLFGWHDYNHRLISLIPNTLTHYSAAVRHLWLWIRVKLRINRVHLSPGTRYTIIICVCLLPISIHKTSSATTPTQSRSCVTDRRHHIPKSQYLMNRD